MLARYTMYRGKRPIGDPLPVGCRMDTRKHTRHCLRPGDEMVVRYLSDPDSYAWEDFAREYLDLLERRFQANRAPFDLLADQATTSSVYLGCSCPTRKNPDVNHCHTVLALRFMADHYPDLDIRYPENKDR